MLIYSPNILPKSFQEKFRTYLPHAHFRNLDTPFPVLKKEPFVDRSCTEPKISYHNVYTPKKILEIYTHTHSYDVERRGSGYSGDYTDHITLDGIFVRLYLGSREALVEKIEYSDAQNTTIGGKRFDAMRPIHKSGSLREDLGNDGVQNFVFTILEEEWPRILQPSLF